MTHKIKDHASKGGASTAKKYGSEYMSKIGKAGRNKQLKSKNAKPTLQKM